MRPETAAALAGKRICLVSSGHIGSNPRLVKEANALHEAGACVHVIALDITRIAYVQQHDHSVIESAPWSCERVSAGGAWARKSRGAVCRIGKVLYRAGLRQPAVLHWAFHPMIAPLGAAAARTPADLYIAHNLAALPAAARAARQHGARLGFDAEDFHSGELNETPENALRLRLTRDIERWYFPRCDYLTAASPGIAKAYASAYGVKEPVVILNVFPKADSPVESTPSGTGTRSPSLYWFSQTIGPDRGLETVVEAIACSLSRPTLYLRGNPSPGYQEQLTALAERHGISDRLRFLQPAPPCEMVRIAAEYDVGLATEVSRTTNRDICLTNKIFTYLLAGVPVLATDTSAQTEIAAGMPDAIFVYPQQDAKALAAKMDELLLSPRSLTTARHAAWQCGHQRFYWELEQNTFLNVIESVFAQPESTKGMLSR